MNSIIFCSFGVPIEKLKWLKPMAGFDFALVYYGEGDMTIPSFVKYHFRNKDFKIPNFIEMLRRYPELLAYDHFFFIDDDLELDAEVFPRWLETVKTEKLNISQASFRPGSKADFPHSIYRESLHVDHPQFVEIGCFCIDKKTLRLTLPFFFMARTGYGLDVAIYQMARRHGLKSAIVHSVMVFHPHRPDAQTVRKQFGQFHEFNAQLEIFLEFCFSEPELIKRLGLASRWFGSTSFSVLRFVSCLLWFASKLARKISPKTG